VLAASSILLSVGVMVVAVGADGAAASTKPARASGNANPFAAQLSLQARAQNAGCAAVRPGKVHCYLRVLKVRGSDSSIAKVGGCKVNAPGGYTACNVEKAYNLKKISATGGVGETVAVVDPMDDPDAEADLGTYRSQYNLPPCTTGNGCFEKVNQEGVEGSYPGGDMGAGQEISLDLDMVSAICPNCHIILVEANSYGLTDLLTSIDTAVSMGADVVSDSWGTGEFDGETSYDSYLDHPGVAITFSSGDGAYQGGVQYPSASPYVTSVGGTMLAPKTNTRGWSEKAWVTKPTSGEPTQGSGSGCSAYEPKPSWQTDSGCSARMTADVSAVAADVLMYDSYESGGGGWYYAFGTSVSSPIIAGVYALAGNSSSVTTPASIPYAHTADLYDITKGSDGTCSPSYYCNAGPGYDGPTGNGSPDGDGAF
jgi:subtilase family serine protease